MYCKNCGKDIEDDSKFCQHCGQNLEPILAKKIVVHSSVKADPLVDKYVNQERTKLGFEPIVDVEIKKKSSSKFYVIAFFLFVIIGACIALPMLLSNNNGAASSGSGASEGSGPYTPQLFTREANNNDITLEVDQDFSLSVKIKVTTLYEIKNLNLEFAFCDKNKNILTTKTRDYSVTTAGTTYEVLFSLSSFSFGEVMKIRSISGSVTSGIISWLQ